MTERSVKDSLWRTVVQEFFTNTLHFPMVLILLELIPEWPRFFSTDPAFYALIGAALLQAYLLGRWQYLGRPRPLIGNLIAPALYTIIEVLLEGPEFFEEPRHIAFWAFALVLGFLQQLRLAESGPAQSLLLLVENVVRSGILLVGFWVFETAGTPGEAGTLAAFLQNDSHIFVALATLFLGLMLGFANLT
ncbi:MAG: adenylate/guanylate cyclase domain-containing protein, partial [Chloroflexota bacterium]